MTKQEQRQAAILELFEMIRFAKDYDEEYGTNEAQAIEERIYQLSAQREKQDVS